MGNDPINGWDPTGENSEAGFDRMAAANRKLGVAIHGRVIGTGADPGPLRLATEWATGTGPANRTLTGQSTFVQNFKNSRSVNKLRSYVYDKFNGNPPDGGSYTEYGNRFDTEYFDPRTSLEEHFLGSYSANVSIENGEMTFVISNKSTTTSFFYGTIVGKFNELTGANVPKVPSYDRQQFGPGGTMEQTITWTERVIPRGEGDSNNNDGPKKNK